jgi:hypothetical protein
VKRRTEKAVKMPKKSSATRPAKRNVRLTAQTRKLLSKHYANKYRVR